MDKGIQNLKRPIILFGISAIIFFLNIYGLLFSISVVLPHLFYFPVILASYWYGKKGIVFTVFLSFFYILSTGIITNFQEPLLAITISRGAMFIIIGIVIALLTLRLHEEEERYSALFRNRAAAAFLLVKKGENVIIEEGNPAAEKLLRYPANALYQMDFSKLFFNPESAEALLSQVSRETEVHEYDTTFITSDGSKMNVIVSGSLLPNNMIVATVTDITSRKRAEEGLIMANEKLNMLERITREDMKKTIGSIDSIFDSLSFTENISEPVLQALIEIKSFFGLLVHQVKFSENYQDLGRQPPEWQYLPGVIGNAVRDVELKGISVRVWLERVSIRADNLIEKVFSCLLENSVKNGVHVTEIVITYAYVPEGLVISYEDNGIGIPLERKESIFSHSADENPGFGLFLAREVLLISNIKIEEIGIPGEGAMFVLKIPEESFEIEEV